MFFQNRLSAGPPLALYLGLIMFAAIVFAITYLVVGAARDRKLAQRDRPDRDLLQPKAILDRRFAEGQLTIQEYQEALRLLGY